MHISSADKEEKPWFLKALKTRRNPFFDKTVRKTGFIQIQVKQVQLPKAMTMSITWDLEDG